MHPDIEQLLKLQEVDEHLLELERSKEYLPEIIANVRKEVEDAETLVTETGQRLEDASNKNRQLEDDLKQAQEDFAKYQTQMASIKTNREYDALTGEIDSTRERIGFIEDEIILTLNEIDELTTALEESKKRHEVLGQSNTEQLANLEKEMNSVEEKVQAKLDERGNITVRVTKPTLSIYERVRRGRVQELRKGLTVINCDNCGRFLMLLNGDES